MKHIKLFKEHMSFQEPKKATKFPCSFTIMTDREGVTSIKKDGYHFLVHDKDELKRYQSKYKKGDTYNGETITSTSVNPANYGEN